MSDLNKRPDRSEPFEHRYAAQSCSSRSVSWRNTLFIFVKRKTSVKPLGPCVRTMPRFCTVHFLANRLFVPRRRQHAVPGLIDRTPCAFSNGRELWFAALTWLNKVDVSTETVIRCSQLRTALLGTKLNSLCFETVSYSQRSLVVGTILLRFIDHIPFNATVQCVWGVR